MGPRSRSHRKAARKVIVFRVTVRDPCREPPAPRAPTSDGSHVGLDPGFIDEDETGRINPRLIFFPTRPAARADVGSESCSAGSTLFLKLIPSRWMKFQTVP